MRSLQAMTNLSLNVQYKYEENKIILKEDTERRNERGKYLKLWPVHAHVDSVIEGPPLEVLVVVGVIDCVVQFFVDLRQPDQTQNVDP